MPRTDKCFFLRCQVTALGKKKAEIKVYSVIDTMKFWPDDPAVTSNDFDRDLKALGDVDELTIRINSPGGVVSEAIAIRTTLMKHPAKKTIDIEGCCDSAATLIACLPGAHVRMAKGAEYMIHRARRGARGTADDLLTAYNNLKKTDEDMADIYAKRTGKTAEECLALMRAETWYNAESAKENGFVDEVMQWEDEPIVACAVDQDTMELMRDCYDHVPDREILNTAKENAENQTLPGADNTVSNEKPAVAAEISPENTGAKPVYDADAVSRERAESVGRAVRGTCEQTRKGVEHMELKEATAEMLNTENPELARSIAQQAVEAERERIQQIEDMTPPGAEYAQMKAEAMKKGTAIGDYIKQIVAEQKKKAGGYMTARIDETAQAKNVTGGAERDQDESPEAKEDKWAKDVADLARAENADTREMM